VTKRKNNREGERGREGEKLKNIKERESEKQQV
jgi:hypothetical protein